MAGEIQLQYVTAGLTARAMLRKPSTNQVWNGSAFVNYATADRDTYAVTLNQEGTASARYVGNMPAVPAGDYWVEVYAVTGGVMSETTDLFMGDGPIVWNGTSVVSQYDVSALIALIPAAVWAVVLSGSLTAAKILRGIAAVIFGRVTSDGAEYHEAGGPGDDTDIVLTVASDTDGNRTVTRNL